MPCAFCESATLGSHDFVCYLPGNQVLGLHNLELLRLRALDLGAASHDLHRLGHDTPRGWCFAVQEEVSERFCVRLTQVVSAPSSK